MSKPCTAAPPRLSRSTTHMCTVSAAVTDGAVHRFCVEVDVSCFNCQDGFMPDGSRCPLCKGTAWIEILGSGMVDPNVFEYVRDRGYDPERIQGFAFGMGIERIAMLKHGIPDLRLMYENDLRFLEQFG